MRKNLYSLFRKICKTMAIKNEKSSFYNHIFYLTNLFHQKQYSALHYILLNNQGQITHSIDRNSSPLIDMADEHFYTFWRSSGILI